MTLDPAIYSRGSVCVGLSVESILVFYAVPEATEESSRIEPSGHEEQPRPERSQDHRNLCGLDFARDAERQRGRTQKILKTWSIAEWA